MNEKGSNGSENGFLHAIKDFLVAPENETYSFNKLWSQRKRVGAKPLITDLQGPTQGEICIGLRENQVYFGKDYYLLGLFQKDDSVYEPIGYLFAERNLRGGSLVSNTVGKGQYKEFKNDPVFTPLIDSIRGGMTFVVEDDFQNRGLGTKLIDTMLEICEKIGAPELILANVSGYVHRLGDTLVQEGKIEYRWIESNGTMYIKKKT